MNEIEKLQSIINTIEVAIAEVEWNYPLDYAIAFEAAIVALKEKLEREKNHQKNTQNNPPMTLEEITNEQYVIFNHYELLKPKYALRNYGKTWVAYRNKKEENV